ncbi:hypothetical protein HMPREF1546_01690 [Oscillibacter sp. KLE 1745]|nr:hypothetical protein HMPREF1546_01690 [Oscillibacter sp. KLE 1745]
MFILLFMFCIRRVSPAPSAPLTVPEEVLLHRAENFFIFFAPLALPYKTGFLFPEKCAIIGADIPNCSDMEVRYDECFPCPAGDLFAETGRGGPEGTESPVL